MGFPTVYDHGATGWSLSNGPTAGSGHSRANWKLAYAAGMARKAAVYWANGLTALMVRPDDLQGDGPIRILRRIEGVLDPRRAAFNAGTQATYRRSPRKPQPARSPVSMLREPDEP